MSEMHMNGHEDANGQSHHAAGFNLMAPDDHTPIRLTKQQFAVLTHLRTKGSITPWIAKYEHQCESLGAVIHQLRKKGFDVKTYRRKDKEGRAFPSYRLRDVQTRAIEEDEPVPLFEVAHEQPTEVQDASESIEPVGEPPTEETLASVKPIAGKRKLDIIKDHLLAGGTISPQTAMDIHGMTGGSLTAIICRLRKENWDITSIPATDDSGYMSYRLAGVEPMADAPPTETRKHDAPESLPPAQGAKVRFIVPLSASETSVTLSRSDFDFMMRIVSEH